MDYQPLPRPGTISSSYPSQPLKRKRDGLDEEILEELEGAVLGPGEALVPDDLDDEDEEPANEPARFGAQVLPIADLPDDFSGAPQDGMQYLFLVRRDASVLPTFTKVPNPYPTPVPEPLPTPPAEPIIASHKEIPTEEWRRTFELRFEALRKTIAAARQAASRGVVVPVPGAKDRDGWWKFINGDLKPGSLPFQAVRRDVGQAASQTVQQKGSGMKDKGKTIVPPPLDEESSEEEEEEVLDDENGIVIQMATIINDDSVPVSKPTPLQPKPPLEPRMDAAEVTPSPAVPITLEPAPGYKPRPPTTAIIAQLESKATYHLVMFFSYWITTRLDSHPALEEGTSSQPALCDNDAKWLFTLLARLDAELSSEQISTLRILARGCLSLLVGSIKASKNHGGNSPKPTIDGKGSCWMIIAAVAKGWGQFDLWEEAVQAVNAECL